MLMLFVVVNYNTIQLDHFVGKVSTMVISIYFEHLPYNFVVQMWIQACAPGFSQTFKRFVPVFKFTKGSARSTFERNHTPPTHMMMMMMMMAITTN